MHRAVKTVTLVRVYKAQISRLRERNLRSGNFVERLNFIFFSLTDKFQVKRDFLLKGLTTKWREKIK